MSSTVKDLREIIKRAYGKDIKLIRVVNTDVGKRFIFNDLLSELYDKPKAQISRNIKIKWCRSKIYIF